MINAEATSDLARRGLSENFLIPGDTEFSFANLPELFEQLFCSDQKTPLRDKLLLHLSRPYQNLLVLFIDAYGFRFSKETHSNPPHDVFLEAASRGVLTKISSQFPSTTAVHVTSFHTGLPQRETGVLEWSYYDSSSGLAVEPLPYRTAAMAKGSPFKADPSFLPKGVLYPHLSALGIESTVLLQQSYLQSPYNQWILGDVKRVARESNQDAFEKCISILKNSPDSPQLLNLYFPEFDIACHRYGPAHSRSKSTLDTLLIEIAEQLLSPLKSVVRGDTLCMIIADHGVADTFPERALHLDKENLIPIEYFRKDKNGPLIGLGSPRNPFFYLEEQYIDETRALLEKACAGTALIYSSHELLEMGVFGRGHCSERFLGNLPDLIALPFDGESIFWKGDQGQFDKGFLGHHGGLTRNEMETTLWAFAI